MNALTGALAKEWFVREAHTIAPTQMTSKSEFRLRAGPPGAVPAFCDRLIGISRKEQKKQQAPALALSSTFFCLDLT